jgi:hypothetical protein
MSPKSVAWIVGAIVVAALSGWMIGASGTSAREQEKIAAEQRADTTQARALLLEGRVSLFLSNFGDASQKFEAAIVVLERIQTQLRETAQAERAGRLQIAIAHVRDAQRLAASFDPSAHTAADEALRTINP